MSPCSGRATSHRSQFMKHMATFGWRPAWVMLGVAILFGAEWGVRGHEHDHPAFREPPLPGTGRAPTGGGGVVAEQPI